MQAQNKIPASFAANKVVAHRGAFKKTGPGKFIASLKEAIRLDCTVAEFMYGDG
jgi:hypothetical protein